MRGPVFNNQAHKISNNYNNNATSSQEEEEGLITEPLEEILVDVVMGALQHVAAIVPEVMND